MVNFTNLPSTTLYLVLLVCGPLATFPSLSSDELCSFIPAVTGALVVLFVVVVVFHLTIQAFITSLANQVMFLVELVSLSVCLSVCLFVCGQHYSKKL